MVLAEHNNRLPPVADKRRALWRRGRQKNDAPRKFFAGHRKSKECSPKIFDFRASGIPAGERFDFFDTLIIYYSRKKILTQCCKCGRIKKESVRRLRAEMPEESPSPTGQNSG